MEAELFSFLPRILEGAWVTARIAGLSILGAAFFGTLWGILRTVPSRPLRWLAITFIEFFRGTSAIVQLFWAFYVLPLIPGMPQLHPETTGILVLSLNGGAFAAAIVAGGIAGVAKGQTEAAHALSLPSRVVLFRIVIPQALLTIVPAFGALAVDIVKGTAIVSFITVQDLLFWGEAIRSSTNDSISVYLVLLAIYIALSVCVAAAFRLIEWALPVNRSVRRPPSSPREVVAPLSREGASV